MLREAAVPSLLLLLGGLTPFGLHAQDCHGEERWQVKVVTDSGSDSVRLQPVVQTTLQDAIHLSQPHLPPKGDNDTRLPEEMNVYQLSGHLVEFKQEAGKKGDSDYHLVITDDTLEFTDDSQNVGPGHSLVAEIPDPDCIPGKLGDPDVPSRFIAEITCVRAKMDAKFPDRVKKGKFNDTGDTPVTIIGVGFFDKAHGQTGRASNNLEIHPILDIDFGDGQPSCLQGGAPQSPAVESLASPAAGAKWEHKSIAASTPQALAAQADAASAQGWELVGVAFDSRSGNYVGFLKRPIKP